MCTGIFLFEPRPVLALNFDYDRTFRLTLENDAAFCMRIRYGDRCGLPLGVNRNGHSANIQIAPFIKQAAYDPEAENRTYIHHIVRDMLGDRLDAGTVPDYLKEHTLTYTEENVGAHCLCADKSGSVCIVEPGSGVLTNRDFPDGFAVLTNFILAKHIPISSDMETIRCKRYRTAYRMLLEDRSGVDRLMDILEAVRRNTKKMPTIFSMVAELDTGKIWFTLDGDFSKRFYFSFSSRSIFTDPFCGSSRRVYLDQNGISAEMLRKLAQ